MAVDPVHWGAPGLPRSPTPSHQASAGEATRVSVIPPGAGDSLLRARYPFTGEDFGLKGVFLGSIADWTKSSHRPASSARRLVIEATFTL